MWLILKNAILMWDNLKKGRTGPNICYICWEAEKNIQHLFTRCKITKEIWNLAGKIRRGIRENSPFNSLLDIWASIGDPKMGQIVEGHYVQHLDRTK